MAEDLAKKKKQLKFRYDENIQIIASSINSKSSKYKCNGMRKPIKALFNRLIQRQFQQITNRSSTNSDSLPIQAETTPKQALLSLDEKIQFLNRLIPSLQSQDQKTQTTILQIFGLAKSDLLAPFNSTTGVPPAQPKASTASQQQQEQPQQG